MRMSRQLEVLLTQGLLVNSDSFQNTGQLRERRIFLNTKNDR